MFIKVFCDGYYSFFPRFCRALYDGGYDISVDFLAENLYRDNDGFFEFLSKKNISGEFVQISYCHPKNAIKNFSAKKSIAIVDSSISGVDQYENLDLMDDVCVFNPYSVINSKKQVVLNYFFEKNAIMKEQDGNLTFFSCFSGRNLKEISETVAAFCKLYSSNKNLSLIVNVGDNLDGVVKNINRTLFINGFVMDDFHDLHIFNNQNSSELIKFADCAMFFGDSDFNTSLIDCMASKVPLIVSESKKNANMCRKNICSVINAVSSVEIERYMKLVIDKPDEIKEKTGKAALFIGNNTKENFMNGFGNLLEKYEIFPASKKFFESNEISEVVL